MARVLGVSLLSALGYKAKFDSFKRRFNSTDNYFCMSACLSGMYKVMKHYAQESYSNGTTFLYELLRDMVIDCEDKLSDSFIVDSNPCFKYSDDYFLSARFNLFTDEEKIDYIVWMTRRKLLDHLNSYDSRVTTLDTEHLTNECRDTSYLVKNLCDTLGIRARVVKIPAAFSDQINLYNGSGFHYFVIAQLNDKEYIIDCTYRQFFKKSNNNLDRLGVVGLCGCDPGIFMMQNRFRKEVALNLLKRGWVRCTEENFKHYLDGFTLSFRNGLYYDWLGRVDYNVTYTACDYLNFLNEDDFITEHEPLEGLGQQEIPLKHSNFIFKRK